MIRSLFARGSRFRRSLTLGAALALVAASAGAQSAPHVPGSDNEPVNPRPRTFQLFGIADQAYTGMRQGGRTYWHTTHSGPSDDNPTVSPADLSGRPIGTASSPNGYCCGYFELQLWALAARSDWARARDNIPSLENVTGGGWNSRTQLSRWVTDQRQLAWTGRDGSIGSLFSGITSTAGDGSCRDNSTRANAFIDAGAQLLAGSDCPPTWANPSRFDGERVVPDTAWMNEFANRGANFTWDDWKIAKSRRDESRLYGAFQTFGATNDFGREQLIYSGSVIPGGVGKPIVEGYPLGIEWEFNVWSYAVPSLGDAMFYKANIINKSASVYGTGIDYDSLFLGFMVRPFHTTSTQQPALYADPARGSVLSAQTNVNATNCYWSAAGGNTKGTGIRSCLGNTHSNRGFRGGAGALVFLKSPIGDMRNKLFTKPGQPFYMPSHPLAGDTLTFNIMTACGFTCATQQITPGRVRAAYGGIIGDVQNALAGRGVTASELSELQYFDLMHNPDWPTRYNPATGTAGGFAKYIPPGNWDYNHDGIKDTMTVTTCWTSSTTANYTGTPVDACVPAFADTFPGGTPNGVHNNYFSGVGPVKLKAGDTTSFIVAFVSVPDSISLERQVTDVVQLYNDFWLSPQPPAPVQIVSASVVGGSRQFDTGVRLFLDQTPTAQTDPFVLEQARKLKTSADTNDIRLRVLNPTLVNDIRARALPAGQTLVDTVGKTTAVERAGTCRTAYTAANCTIVSTPTLGVVDSVFVFKSCDGGTTFTATGGAACVPAPARDVATGAPSGYSWQSYARLAKNAAGQWPSQFFDGNVTGGVTYTYVIVSQSYPVSFRVIDVVGGNQVVREYLVRPKTQNGLTANSANRNVATVYVPASTQAGGAVSAARFVNFSTAGFVASDTAAALNVASFRLSRPIRGAEPIPGRLIFSDSAVVREFDADTTVGGVDSTEVTLYELVLDSIGIDNVLRRRPGRTERFVVPGSAGPVDLVARKLGTSTADTATATAMRSVSFVIFQKSQNVTDTSRVVTYNYRFRTFQKPVVTFVVDGRPIYVTDSIPGGGDLTPSATQSRTDFIGAMLSLNTPTISTQAPNATVWRAPGIPVLRSPAWPTIAWQNPANNLAVARDTLAYGRYRFDFSDSEFGSLAPFTFDPRNPQALKDRYAESIAGRKIADVTVNDTATLRVLNAALGRTAANALKAESLAVLSLPFQVKNLRFGGQKVQLAVLKKDVPATALLGLGGDTLRVPVPAGKWIPGVNLYFIEKLPTFKYDTIAGGNGLQRLHRGPGGAPDTTYVLKVTWGPMRLGCGTPITCNPIEGFASSGYTQAGPGLQYETQWYAPLRGLQSVDFELLPEVAGQQVAAVPTSELKNVRAVPNPYIMFSEYEQTPGTKRMMFVGLPPTGTLRIYTASGQFVQQITWVESDLEKNCRATTVTTECIATGDLTWNLRSHENKEIGPGFYMFVVSTNVGGTKKDRIGKFVVIH